MKLAEKPAMWTGIGLAAAAVPWAVVAGWAPFGGPKLALIGGIGLGVAVWSILALVFKEPESPAQGDAFVGAGMQRAQADRKRSIRTLVACFIGTGYWLLCRLAILATIVRSGDLH